MKRGEDSCIQVKTTTPQGKTVVWHDKTPEGKPESSHEIEKRKLRNRGFDQCAQRILKRQSSRNEEAAPSEKGASNQESHAQRLQALEEADACLNRGRVLLRNGDLSGAEAEFRAAISKNPRCFASFYQLSGSS